MKMLAKLSYGIILAISILSSCKKEKGNTSPGNVIFKVQSENKSSLNITKTKDAVIASSILVSIEKLGGGVVYNKEKLVLSQLNGTYLSKVLPLESGSYNLTEFLVLDANNKIIYATPKKGSKLEYLVKKPLPIYFECQSGQENIVIPEVVRTDSSFLNDLGYVGFSFNDVNSILFLINVVAKDSTQPNYESIDSSNLYIYKNIEEPQNAYNFTLRNTINQIYLSNDTGKFILNVYKPGYASWSDTLTRTQLESYSKSPLQVVLKPVKSITINYVNVLYNVGYTHFIIQKRASNDFYVNEGYGAVHILNSNIYNHLSPSYVLNSIEIWKNLNDIQSIYMEGYIKVRSTRMGFVDFRAATTLESLELRFATIEKLYATKSALKKLTLYYSNVPMSLNGCVNLEHIDCKNSAGVLDIHTCDKLQSISIDGTNTIIFGSNPLLTNVALVSVANFNITEDQVNTVLIDLLKSVIQSPRAGSFDVDNIYFSPTYVLPTGAGLTAAKTLRDTYNWTFGFTLP